MRRLCKIIFIFLSIQTTGKISEDDIEPPVVTKAEHLLELIS
jgi:hypothetical protein